MIIAILVAFYCQQADTMLWGAALSVPVMRGADGNWLYRHVARGPSLCVLGPSGRRKHEKDNNPSLSHILKEKTSPGRLLVRTSGYCALTRQRFGRRPALGQPSSCNPIPDPEESFLRRPGAFLAVSEKQ